MAVYLGFDGGGTKVSALAVDDAGRMLFEGRSGPANWASTPRADLLDHLWDACLGVPTPMRVVACLAGILTEDDAQELSHHLRERFPASEVAVYPDYVAAWAAHERGLDPILVLAGTGSIVVSRLPDGRVLKSGGRGPLLGDEGSLFDIGREVIRKIGETDTDPRWKAEMMGGTASYDAWIAEIYRAASPAARIASIGAEAAKAHPTGESIARAAASRLAGVVLAHLRDRQVWTARPDAPTPWRLPRSGTDRDPSAIVLAGGSWDAWPSYEGLFREALGSAAGDGQGLPEGCIIDRLRQPPVFGAARLARQWSL